MPTTEIASFPLKAGIRIGDPDDASAGVFKDIFATLMRQDGMQQVHFGPGVEDPTMLHLFVSEWHRRLVRRQRTSDRRLT